jgi:hypothetical protein
MKTLQLYDQLCYDCPHFSKLESAFESGRFLRIQKEE